MTSRVHVSCAFAVLLSACGANPPASSTTSEGVPDRCSGPCIQNAVCQRGFAWQCTCTQIHDVNCGGAPRVLDAPTWQWSCAPRDPTADRGDGCPFAAPTDGDACDVVRTCRYAEGPCGWEGRDATCDGAHWSLVAFSLPPPP